MTRYKKQGINKTFNNAGKGFRLVMKSERNVRIHLIIASIVIMLGFLLQFEILQFCIILFAISNVIVAEMLNSAIEFALDSIYHNKYNKMVGMAKDISAGAVMFATIISSIVGIIIFGKAIFDLIFVPTV